jgi:hypothetical protein
MQALSSDADFNKLIIETKPDKREIKSKSGLPPFRYIISTERKKKDFLKKFGIIDEEGDNEDNSDKKGSKKEKEDKE